MGIAICKILTIDAIGWEIMIIFDHDRAIALS
jgi:hypothetical protein